MIDHSNSAGYGFAASRSELTHRDDGVVEVSSHLPLSPHPQSTLSWLRDWALATPRATLLSEVVDGTRVLADYATAWASVVNGAEALKDAGVRPGDRVVVASLNGFDSFVAGHAAMLMGAIWVPIATQYLAPGAHPERLLGVLELTEPHLVVVPDQTMHAAIPARYHVVDRVGPAIGEATPIDNDAAGIELLAQLRSDTTAKLLMTSGSTGTPKAVIYTHGMLVDNVRATADVWPFVSDHRPILVDWLPWNHAFGGNANLNMVLLGGGTLHVDDSHGRPSELRRTVQAIKELSPTYYAAVPASFQALLPFLDTDPELRRALFARCDALFSAGAAMQTPTFLKLQTLSRTVREDPVPVLSGWGSTEVGPGATIVNSAVSQPGWIGPPLPGVTIRLVPVGDKLELRVKGASVTPGYWGQAELSAAAFDDDGFYRSGDAGLLVDPDNPELGLRFDGRIAEDFKLSNGSWVNVDRVRSGLLATAGTGVRDIVLAGPDRSHLVALFWLAEGATVDIDAVIERYNSGVSGRTNTILRGLALEADPPADVLSPKNLIKPGAFRQLEHELIDHLYLELLEATP